MPVQRPRVSAEADLFYVNAFMNRRVEFKAAQDELVITTQPGFSANALGALAVPHRFGVVAARPERGLAVLRHDADTDALATFAPAARDPQIANVLPVLIDRDGLRRYFVPDEVTVQFTAGTAPERCEAAIAAAGCSILVRQRTPGYFTLLLGAGAGLFATLQSLNTHPDVAFAEPSEFGLDDALSYIPDDAEFGRLWGLHNTAQMVNGVTGTADCDIDAPEAWDIERGRPEVVVAVIDTGADLDHPDLAPRLLERGTEDWDFASDTDDVPEDEGHHGSHVAGTAVGANNAGGVIGVAPGCSLMPLRVNLTVGMNANRADAINYVTARALAEPGRRYVINCSWKMNGDHAGVHSALISAVASNILPVFAAGNFNEDLGIVPTYPAVYPEVFTVAATDQNDVRANFSNHGAPVDVCAPGVNIYSCRPDKTFQFLDGTSMASPHVAGLAALVLSRNRHLSVAALRSILVSSCDDISARNPGFAGKLGGGRINAARALRATPPPQIEVDLVRKLPFPYPNDGSSTGLAFIRAPKTFPPRPGRLVFITQRPGAEPIVFLNAATGATLSSIVPAGVNQTIGTVEWDGRNLRVANVTNGTGRINTIDPTTGAQLGSISAPEGRGEALTLLRQPEGAPAGTPVFLYSTVSRLFALTSSGATIASFPPPGGACYGLACANGLVWSCDGRGRVHLFHPVTHVSHGYIALPSAGSGVPYQAIAVDPARRELYVAHQPANAILVFRYSL